MMKLEFVCIVFLSLLSIVLSQNTQIQAQPQHVNYHENDLVILCSIANPSQITSVYYIILEQNRSTGFEASVYISKDQTPQISWPPGSLLQNRASATGTVDTPSSAQLRLTIDKNSVQCPTDFTAYKCKMSGFSSATSNAVTQETNPITVTFSVQPRMIQIPTIKMLGQPFDTNQRKFPVATALQLTCEGQVGNDPSKTIRWCAKKSSDFSFTGLPQTPIHSEAISSGCQYTRSSTITYNLTSTDTFTQFLCESGDEGLCGTGSAIQNVNISIETYPSETPDETQTGNRSTNHEIDVVIGSVVGTLVLLTTVIVLVYFARKHYKCTCEKRSEEKTSNNPQKSSDVRVVEDNSGYITILADTDRYHEVYDEIATPGDRNQYESLNERGCHEAYTHQYEVLKKGGNNRLAADNKGISFTNVRY